MSNAIEELMTILDLETLEQNLFRGISPKSGWQRVFGGQVIGQALVAAIRTVGEDRTAHSLHGYFMRPGDPKVPIIYEVHRDRDGSSFSTRRVVAIQHGEPIFSMGASFHVQETGLEHQISMPDVPSPESLPSEAAMVEEYRELMPENMRNYFERERPIEMRPVDLEHYMGGKPSMPEQLVWIRATSKLPDVPALHQCVLAYASDMTLLDTSLVVHGRSLFDPEMMMASLDHALWFHRPCRADEWLLYAQDSPSSVAGLGFNRGSFFTRDGVLVASTAQEGLIRVRRPKK
jgi:acyl-CoA thioesterase-2